MPSPKTVSFFGFDELVCVPSDYLDAAPRPLRRRPQAANEGTLVTGIALDHVCSRGRSRPRAFEQTKATTEWPFAKASRRSAVRFRPLHPKQEPSCSISIFIGVNVAVHAVTAFSAAAKTSRAAVAPAPCSLPSPP